jgi:hypothetical protein
MQVPILNNCGSLLVVWGAQPVDLYNPDDDLASGPFAATPSVQGG